MLMESILIVWRYVLFSYHRFFVLRHVQQKWMDVMSSVDNEDTYHKQTTFEDQVCTSKTHAVIIL